MKSLQGVVQIEPSSFTVLVLVLYCHNLVVIVVICYLLLQVLLRHLLLQLSTNLLRLVIQLQFGFLQTYVSRYAQTPHTRFDLLLTKSQQIIHAIEIQYYL